MASDVDVVLADRAALALGAFPDDVALVMADVAAGRDFASMIRSCSEPNSICWLNERRFAVPR